MNAMEILSNLKPESIKILLGITADIGVKPQGLLGIGYLFFAPVQMWLKSPCIFCWFGAII